MSILDIWKLPEGFDVIITWLDSFEHNRAHRFERFHPLGSPLSG